MANLQTMGAKAFCSSVGDVEKLEKFKQLDLHEKLGILQKTYDEHGVRSPEFFTQVKPFIMWIVNKYRRGMHYTLLEELVNTSYEELIIAFEGGWTWSYNKLIYMEPIYKSDEYFEKYQNIGKFVIGMVGRSVAKYRSKFVKKKLKYEDVNYDISDRLGFSNFEVENGLDYYLDDINDEPLFTKFKLNADLIKHLKMLYDYQPRNNLLYNFILWKTHK